MRRLARNAYAFVSGGITRRCEAHPLNSLNLPIAVGIVENEGSAIGCNFLNSPGFRPQIKLSGSGLCPGNRHLFSILAAQWNNRRVSLLPTMNDSHSMSGLAEMCFPAIG